MYDTIRQHLQENDLPCDEACRPVVDVSVDCALEYVLDYAISVSEQLMRDKKNYDQARVAGMFVNKIKGLLGR